MSQTTPVDIRRIRQSLGLTMCEMGTFISIYSNGVGSVPFPATRINEWEMGVRPVPKHVFTAAAKLLLDIWSEDRHKAPEEKKAEVDVFFGALLSPPLGEVFKLEALLKVDAVDPLEVVHHLAKVRNSLLQVLEKDLTIKTGYVFEPNLGPETEE